MNKDMRARHVATALAAVTAGLTAAAALRSRATVIAAPAVPESGTARPERDAVVLQFVRPAAPGTQQPAAPARCGDNGGRTKAGAPCAARATTDGRCHHHPIAA